MTETGSSAKRQTWLIIGAAALLVLCACVAVALWGGRGLLNTVRERIDQPGMMPGDSPTAELIEFMAKGLASFLLLKQKEAEIEKKVPEG